MSDPYAPHVVVALVTYEVHQKLPTGEASGQVVEVGKKRVVIEGFNLQDCKEKLEKFLGGQNA